MFLVYFMMSTRNPLRLRHPHGFKRASTIPWPTGSSFTWRSLFKCTTSATWEVTLGEEIVLWIDSFSFRKRINTSILGMRSSPSGYHCYLAKKSLNRLATKSLQGHLKSILLKVKFLNWMGVSSARPSTLRVAFKKS
jgi:hypothetical protein